MRHVPMPPRLIPSRRPHDKRGEISWFKYVRWSAPRGAPLFRRLSWRVVFRGADAGRHVPMPGRREPSLRVRRIERGDLCLDHYPRKAVRGTHFVEGFGLRTAGAGSARSDPSTGSISATLRALPIANSKPQRNRLPAATLCRPHGNSGSAGRNRADFVMCAAPKRPINRLYSPTREFNSFGVRLVPFFWKGDRESRSSHRSDR
jgi:hypothetical protein